MNLILLFPDDFIPGTNRVHLTGRRQKHVLEVHKVKPGEILIVGVENGRRGQGRVIRLDDRSLDMDVTLDREPPAKLPVVLCCALMRPIVLKRVLLTAASMGVGEIVLFHSRRVEKSFWQSTALKEAEIREQLVLGLEQAKDTVLPRVSCHKRFRPFVEDTLPGLLEGRIGLVADPSGESLDKVVVCRSLAVGLDATPDKLPPPASSVLILGPEGGFIPYEIEKFKEAGCQIVSLGERVLKVETAVVSLLAKMF